MKTVIVSLSFLFVGNVLFGQDSDELKLPCLEKLEIVNAISPNGDETNDFLSIDLECNPAKFSFQVFNRWGERVYESNDPNFKWDGTDADENQLPQGVYFWTMNANIDGIEANRKSNVTIMY